MVVFNLRAEDVNKGASDTSSPAPWTSRRYIHHNDAGEHVSVSSRFILIKTETQTERPITGFVGGVSAAVRLRGEPHILPGRLSPGERCTAPKALYNIVLIRMKVTGWIQSD